MTIKEVRQIFGEDFKNLTDEEVAAFIQTNTAFVDKLIPFAMKNPVAKEDIDSDSN